MPMIKDLTPPEWQETESTSSSARAITGAKRCDFTWEEWIDYNNIPPTWNPHFGNRLSNFIVPFLLFYCSHFSSDKIRFRSVEKWSSKDGLNCTQIDNCSSIDTATNKLKYFRVLRISAEAMESTKIQLIQNFKQLTNTLKLTNWIKTFKQLNKKIQAVDSKTDQTMLKENCNAKTSWFHLNGRSKSCKMRPKSLKSAKPFSRYSTLKIEIWTILREKTTEKPKMLFF